MKENPEKKNIWDRQDNPDGPNGPERQNNPDMSDNPGMPDKPGELGKPKELDRPDQFWKDDVAGPVDIPKVPRPPKEINFKGENVRNALAQLVLTVVELLRDLLEKQALTRIESGELPDEQVENLGMTFMQLKKEVEKLRDYFQLEEEDLNLDLGPLMLRESEVPELKDKKVSAVELLNRLLQKGVVAKGDIVISVAGVDLIAANLGLVLASIDKSRELYQATSSQLQKEVMLLRAENTKLKSGFGK